MENKLEHSLVITLLACCVKLLLLPSYHSTDFEVHRNWMAITHSLPLKEWYFERTSEWTLDYPPFFAYFEWVLSHFAKMVEPQMLEVDNLEYASDNTVLFMRGSVIITDLLLLYATWLYLTSSKQSYLTHVQVFTLTALNAGLLLVDHIHFQYNGILMGLLVLCLYCAAAERYLLLATAYSTLVLMKHLFVPLAPILAIFLIQKHCFRDVTTAGTGAVSKGGKRRAFSVFHFLQLAVVAAVALGAAFGPFLAQINGKDQMLQVMSRLFPFGRGLVHAYWAPNAWALYCAADKLFYAVIRKLRLPALTALLREGSASGLNNSASGIVGDFIFSVLPPVSASACLLLLLLTLLPAMVVIYRRPTAQTLLVCLVYASLSNFIWGYHVHEKAIIIPLLLQTFTLMDSTYSGEEGEELASVGEIRPSPTVVEGEMEKTTAEAAAESALPEGRVAGGVRSKRGKVNRVAVATKPGASGGAAVAPQKAGSGGEGSVGSAEPAAATSTAVKVSPGAVLARQRRHRQQHVLFLNKALFGLLTIAGVYGLFPLFYTLPEVFSKGGIYAAYVAGMWAVLFPASPASAVEGAGRNRAEGYLKVQLGLCLVSMVALFAFTEVLHPVLFLDATSQEVRLPFLPRLLTSVVCGLYLFVAWGLSALVLWRML